MENSNQVPSVIIPEVMAPVTTIEVASDKPVLGVKFMEFEYGGKSYKLDTAVIIGKGTKSLMNLSMYADLQGVKKSKNAEAFKKIQATYNTEVKPAFWAFHNSIVDFARTKLEVRGVGLRQRADGTVSASASWVSRKTDNAEKLSTEAGRFIANGDTKQEEQSKSKGKRQSKGKGKTEESAAAPVETPSETAAK